MKIEYVVAHKSITGARAAQGKINEDSFFVLQKKVQEKEGNEELVFFAGVADGVGGLYRGDIASNYIKEQLVGWFEENWDTIRVASFEEVKERLHEEILLVHEQLRQKAREENVQMGSTLVVLFQRKDAYFFFNIGDSRGYLLQGKELVQVTRDQTEAQRATDAGMLQNPIPKEDRRWHTLLQAVGASKNLVPAYHAGQVKGDFLFFLCSDGMTNRISHLELQQELQRTDTHTQKEKLIALMKLAIMREETDNLTGMILKRRFQENDCRFKPAEDERAPAVFGEAPTEQI